MSNHCQPMCKLAGSLSIQESVSSETPVSVRHFGSEVSQGLLCPTESGRPTDFEGHGVRGRQMICKNVWLSSKMERGTVVSGDIEEFKLMGHRPVLSDDVTDSYKQLMVSFRSVALWLKPG